MTLTQAVDEYGYWAVLVGCFIEGETVLVLASLAAQLGVLSLPIVLIAAATGGFLNDQTAFWLGRVFGPTLMARSQHLQRLQPRIRDALERHTTWIGFSVRFAIGLRTAVPMAVGATGGPPLRFMLPNVAGAIVWACVVGGIAYAFGAVAAPWFDTATSYGMLGVLAVVIVLVLSVAARRFAKVWWMRAPSSKESDA